MQPVQVEALLRWDHPGRGLLAPGRVPRRRGRQLAARAHRLVGGDRGGPPRRAWRHAFPNRPITVAVNLFDDHLERRDLPNRIEYLLHDNEVPAPRRLAFEVGEHHLLSEAPPDARPPDGAAQLRRDVIVDDLGAAAAATDVDPDALRDWAVELFGTLRAFPLDLVKLDPRFVRRLESDERSAAVIDAAHASATS